MWFSIILVRPSPAARVEHFVSGVKSGCRYGRHSLLRQKTPRLPSLTLGKRHDVRPLTPSVVSYCFVSFCIVLYCFVLYRTTV